MQLELLLRLCSFRCTCRAGGSQPHGQAAAAVAHKGSAEGQG